MQTRSASDYTPNDSTLSTWCDDGGAALATDPLFKQPAIATVNTDRMFHTVEPTEFLFFDVFQPTDSDSIMVTR